MVNLKLVEGCVDPSLSKDKTFLSLFASLPTITFFHTLYLPWDFSSARAAPVQQSCDEQKPPPAPQTGTQIANLPDHARRMWLKPKAHPLLSMATYFPPIFAFEFNEDDDHILNLYIGLSYFLLWLFNILPACDCLYFWKFSQATIFKF